MYVIYIHTNRINRKPYIGWAIIGSGQTPHDAMMRRWEAHCKNTRPDLFPRAIVKWGADAWDHEILDVVSELAAAKHTEKLWITHRHTCVFDPGGHGYNMTRGGDGGGMLGHVPTLEHREKISAALIGKPKSLAGRKAMSDAKIGAKHPFFGMHRPDAVRLKCSIAQRGEKAPNARLTEARKLIIVARWENRATVPVTQQQLAVDNGVTQSTVSRLLNRKTWK